MKCLADDTTSNTPNNSMARSSNDSMTNSSNKAMSDSSNHTMSDSVANSNSLRVDSSAMVVDVLDTAVRKVDRVGALPGSSAIVSLRSIKASSRVVVGHSVLVGVGGNLVRVNLSHSVTHNRMADTMTNTNTMADTNTM